MNSRTLLCVYIFVFLVCCITASESIKKNVRKRSTSISTNFGTYGVNAITLSVADPTTYDHSVGGGSTGKVVPALDLHEFVCDEKASIFVQVAVGGSFVGTQLMLTLTPHASLIAKNVTNACAQSPTDPNCANSGGVVVTMTTPSGSVALTFTKVQASSNIVSRVDFAFNCALLPSTNVAAVTEGLYTIPGKTPVAGSGEVDFANPSSILNCSDNNPCTVDTSTGAYCSRTCVNTPKKL